MPGWRFLLKTDPEAESSEKTPSAEVPRAFHSDVGVEAALDLLVTGLTHALSPGSFPPYTCHTGIALMHARTSDPLGMHRHFSPVFLVSRRHWRRRPVSRFVIQ